MEAYTYTIKHKPSGRYYYGVRKSTIFDLGKNYLSSSKLVKRLIFEDGVDQFEFKLRKKFESYEQARLHESKVLSRLKVPRNPSMLNQAISSPRVCSNDVVSEQNRRASISKAMKELWKDPSYRAKFTEISKEEKLARGRPGAIKRAENYRTGKTSRKQRSPRKAKPYKQVYKQVTIVKGEMKKVVFSNQVPAYSKYGWSREWSL